MTVRIVRLGCKRFRHEGLRIGTVRRPPRGVPKSQYSTRNWYDVWFPELAPSAELLKKTKTFTTERDWTIFKKKYRAEMAAHDKDRLLILLAAMSHQADFSVDCYCAEESRCHRSVLRALLMERGALVE